jgi:hypothetical protein
MSERSGNLGLWCRKIDVAKKITTIGGVLYLLASNPGTAVSQPRVSRYDISTAAWAAVTDYTKWVYDMATAGGVLCIFDAGVTSWPPLRSKDVGLWGNTGRLDGIEHNSRADAGQGWQRVHHDGRQQRRAVSGT